MSTFRLSDRIRSFGPALRGIAVLVRDEHPAVRADCARAVAVVPAPTSREILQGLATDPDRAVRKVVADALARARVER